VLAYEVGDEFLKYWYQAEEGRLDPFVLVVEGSIPNEEIKREGYWAALGTDRRTGQPIPTCEWIDRLAPKAWAVVAAGTCATYGGIHALAGNPTGCMGLADYITRIKQKTEERRRVKQTSGPGPSLKGWSPAFRRTRPAKAGTPALTPSRVRFGKAHDSEGQMAPGDSFVTSGPYRMQPDRAR
jgi:hypothetical protein